MRRFIKFVFPFLFVRNWHSGEQEFSRDRVVLFGGAIIILIVGVCAVAFLQAPIQYANTP